MNAFFTSDTHFGHEKIIQTSCMKMGARSQFKTVEEMNDTLVENWNSIVGRKDVVYHLGDFAWRDHAKHRGRLNGHIILIKGNHEGMNQKALAQFSEVHDVLIRTICGHDIFMSHYAHRTWSRSIHGSWHLYGHSHGSMPEPEYMLSFDVGVDVWDYTPVPMEAIERKMAVIEEWRQNHPFIADEAIFEKRKELADSNRKFRS